MTRHRSSIRRQLLIMAGLSLLASCTSSHTSGNNEPQAIAPASTPVAISSPPVTSTFKATGTATDEQGDALAVSFYINRAVKVNSSASDDAIRQCGNDMAAVGSSLDRALAVHFNIDFRVTSSLSTPVQIDLNSGLHQVTPGGNTGPPDQMPYWAMDFSDGHVCQAPGDGTYNPGTITWQTAGPHAEYTASGWLILPNALTPNDPDGNQSYASRIVIIPTVRLGIALATFTFGLHDPGVVDCSLPDSAAGTTLFMAANRDAAIAFGCN